MKVKYILAILALTATVSAQNIDRLVEALVRTESRGNASAVGDNGKALGILQIHDVMVQDFNRITGSNYKHADMFNETLSREVARGILNFYSKHIEKTMNRKATEKELGFIWNGGGGSWRRVASPMADTKQKNLEAYWAKVYKNLK
jgi:glutamate synthase domain-containing protein 1